MKTPDMRLTLIATSLSAVLMTGCGGMIVSEKSGQIRIASDPAGAKAYANGNELGATPLQITPGEHFRSGFVGLSYRYYGKLSLKKPGCEDQVIDVNDYILSRDINAKLKCDPNYQPPVAAPANHIVPSSNSFSERLERLDSLKKKGLVSEEEYQQQRKRILGEL